MNVGWKIIMWGGNRISAVRGYRRTEKEIRAPPLLFNVKSETGL